MRSGLRWDAQGGAFLENRRSPGNRSRPRRHPVAALLGVAVESIGAATARERLLAGSGIFIIRCAAAGVMSNLCH